MPLLAPPSAPGSGLAPGPALAHATQLDAGRCTEKWGENVAGRVVHLAVDGGWRLFPLCLPVRATSAGA